jgi:hypothetical protein
MPLKRIVLFLLILILSGKLFAQKQTADIGIFVGGATPLGDYTKTNFLQSVNLDFAGFYRYNYSSRFSLRINAMYGTVGASGEFNTIPQPPFKKNVFDLDVIIEINYLDFMLGVKQMKFSPYVYTGLGLTLFPGLNGQTFTPNLPIGVGVKYALGKYFAVGAEASLHKLFADDLDNLDNPYQSTGMIDVNDIWHNNDWISYFGLTLTYRFYKGNKACPAYNTIN